MTSPAFGVITGVISEDSAIKPACRVACIDRATLEVVDTVVSDAYGVYRFEFLDPARKYTILALDDDTVAGVSGTDTPPSGRYVRVVLGAHAGDGAHKGIAEIEVASTAGGADLITGGTPVYASTYDGSNPPAALKDNSAAVGWYNRIEVEMAPSVVADLGSSQTVYEVRLQVNPYSAAYFPREVMVQLSDDGVAFDTVGYYVSAAAPEIGAFITIVLGPRATVTTYNTDGKNAVVADYVTPVEGFRDWDTFYREVVRLSPNAADILFFDSVFLHFASCTLASSVYAESLNRIVGVYGYEGQRCTHAPRRTQSALPGPYYPHAPGKHRTRLMPLSLAWSAHASYSVVLVVELPSLDDVVLLGAYFTFLSPLFMTPRSQGLMVSRRAVVARHTKSNNINDMLPTAYIPASPLPSKFMVTMVVTGSTKVELFVDGALVTTATHISGVTADGSGGHAEDLMLSARQTGALPPSVSCVARIPAVLSAAQVAALHSARTLVPPTVTRTYSSTLQAMRPIHYCLMDNATAASMIDQMLGAAMMQAPSGSLSVASGFTSGVPALAFSNTWVGTTTTLSVLPGGNGVAITLWVRMAALPGGNVTLAGTTDSGGNQAHLTIGLTSTGRVRIRVNNYEMIADAPALATGTDYLLVLQSYFTADNGPCIDLFVNGVLAQRFTRSRDYPTYITHPTTTSPTQRFIVGAHRANANGVAEAFAGDIGHAALFNRSLSEDEVATLYAARTL